MDHGSVLAPVDSMGTAGADRSAAEIAVELPHVRNLRLDGCRILKDVNCDVHCTPPPSRPPRICYKQKCKISSTPDTVMSTPLIIVL